MRLRLGLYAYLEPLNDWRVRYAASYALVYGPLVMVALTQADEHSLKAAPTRVREWVNVSKCAPSWAELRLSAMGGDGHGFTLIPLGAAVAERYTAHLSIEE